MLKCCKIDRFRSAIWRYW